MTFINIVLMIYTWIAISILLFFLFGIARFYEIKSGRRSFYPAFLVPIVMFGIAAIRYVIIVPTIVGDLWGDATRFVGGLILGGFGLFLLKLMMGGRS